MLDVQSNQLVKVETTCGSLLHELQIIWDEVGESDNEKDRMLHELEQECLEVYRRKVDQANKSRAQLRRAIADAEAELASICASMGERPVHIRQIDQNIVSLKAELRAILPQIEEMRKRKYERKNQFLELLQEIHRIKNEIHTSGGHALNSVAVDESDLSLRKLEDLQRELQALQKEKSERLKQVLDHLNHLHSCCSVLGLDFKQTVNEIHPSLGESEGSQSISDKTIGQLGSAIQRLREVKNQRLRQLQDLGASLLELWNLMDTPAEEQQMFQKVTCNIVASEDEIIESNLLSADFITCVKSEVTRLEELKASKMKELVLKKKLELEEVCKKTHMAPESDSAFDIALDAIESGAVDASCVLEQIEIQISKVKEEAFSRKEILEKVEKWMSACEEESWLEEYNRDDNRYSAARGAHLTLKRAEKARALVNKLPAMVDTLISKTIAWEKERGVDFNYNGIRLLSMLEDYKVLRQEKELERKRERDQKKLQGQLLTEQEALYGSKPSPMKNVSAKKGNRMSSVGTTSSRRLSLGASMHQTLKPELPPPKATPNTCNGKKNKCMNQDRLRDDGFSALSTGRRGLDLAGLPIKQNAPSTQETESPMTRKPFSPISSNESSKPIEANILEDFNKKQSEIFQKIVSNTVTPVGTPSKIDVENRTPQPQNAFATPSSTTSTPFILPMQMANTPAPVQKTIGIVQSPATLIAEKIEYSFEEIRAGFVVPGSNQYNAVQV